MVSTGTIGARKCAVSYRELGSQRRVKTDVELQTLTTTTTAGRAIARTVSEHATSIDHLSVSFAVVVFRPLDDRRKALCFSTVFFTTDL